MRENPKVSGRDTPSKTPGWVKIFVVILIVLVVIVVLAHLTGFRVNRGASVNFGSLASLIRSTTYPL